MKLTSVLCAIALFVASPALAGDPRSAACDLTGSWYGGSDAGTPYLATFGPSGSGPYSPFGPERYTAEFKLGADVVPLGIASWTGWFGEGLRTGRRRFETFIIAFFVLTPEAAAEWGLDGTLPELQAVHAVHELSEDCSTMTVTIDRYDDILAFDSTTMVPFLTPPDYEWISEGGGEPLLETYRRMPTALAPLPSALRATDASRPAAPRRLRGR